MANTKLGAFINICACSCVDNSAVEILQLKREKILKGSGSMAVWVDLI